MEDLWAFNEEKVARAIFRCPIPVISAVGHEIDFTIADFVADIRASTPSVAAEIVIKEEESLRERIENLEKRLAHNQRYYLQEQKHEVLSLTQHRAFQNMMITLLNLAQKVDELDMRAWNAIRNRQQKISEDRSRTELLEEKIRSALKEMLQQFHARWETLSAQLHNLSPLNILKKGYALCWKNGGQYLVRKIEEVEKEKEMTVSFFKGEFTCLVKEVDKTKHIESRSESDTKK